MARQNKWDSKHQKDLERYARKIDAIYQSAVREAAAIGATIPNFSPDKPFSFADYPSTQQRVQKLIDELKNNIQMVILNGVDSEWTLANNKNDELCNVVFGKNVKKLTTEQERRYYRNNGNACDAFKTRKIAGLNLSDRVWNYTNQFKTEIEMGLDLGLRDGLSAAEMSRDLRQYLKYPDKLFRRVRDEHGQLHLSQAAKAFNPGQGVYRSSYKNAMRLTRTETNMAYRTSDYTRWQQLDFVVGIEIRTSNNHPIADICDELAGRYPKDFKFTGWHPQCRCHAVSILKTDEEMAADNERIMNDEPLTGESVNRIDDVPMEFKDWLKKNDGRAKKSYSIPYFAKDNPQYLPKGYLKLWGLKTPYEDYATYEKAMRYNKAHANFSKEQMKNIRELNDRLPVIQGQIMPFGLADSGHPNPNFSIENARELGYHHNCQTCTVAYELRLRGFDVTAMANPVVHTMDGVKYREVDFLWLRKQKTWEHRFLNPDGTEIAPIKSGVIENTVTAKKAFIEANTQAQGRYEVYCRWNEDDAHVFIVEKRKNGNLVWYDPQSGEVDKFADRYLKKMEHSDIWVTRIDDKIIDPEFAERLLKSE